MQLDKQFVLDEIRNKGRARRCSRRSKSCPDKIDREQHAALLEKFGIDPGKIAERAVESGIAHL